MSIETLHNKFKSGNSIPVERSTITRDEYEAIAKEFRELEEEYELLNTGADLLCSQVDELLAENEKLKLRCSDINTFGEQDSSRLEARIKELEEDFNSQRGMKRKARQQRDELAAWSDELLRFVKSTALPVLQLATIYYPMSSQAKMAVTDARALVKRSLAMCLAETQRQIKSKVTWDGYPTFYIGEDGTTCTHRMSESDIPVWCRTGEDGLEAMSRIQGPLAEIQAAAIEYACDRVEQRVSGRVITSLFREEAEIIRQGDEE